MRPIESSANAHVNSTLSDLIYHACMGLISFGAILMTRSSILTPASLQNPVFLFFSLLSFYYLLQYTVHQLHTAYSANLINYKMCLDNQEPYSNKRLLLFSLKHIFLVLSNAALLGMTAAIIVHSHLNNTALILYFLSYQAVTMLRNYFSHSTAFDFIDTQFQITSNHEPSEKLLYCSQQSSDPSLWNTVYHNVDADLLKEHKLTCQLSEALKPHGIDAQKEQSILFQPVLLTHKTSGKTLWAEYEEARHHVHHLFSEYNIAPFTNPLTQNKIRQIRSFIDTLTNRLKRVDQFQSSLRVITQSSDFKNYTQALSCADAHYPTPQTPYATIKESSGSTEITNLLNEQRNKLTSLVDSTNLPIIRRDDIRIISQIIRDSSQTLSQKTRQQLTTVIGKIPCMTPNNPFALLIHLFPNDCTDSLDALLHDDQLKNRVTSPDFLDTLQGLTPELRATNPQHLSNPAEYSLLAFLKDQNLDKIHDIIKNHAASDPSLYMRPLNTETTAYQSQDPQQCAVTGEPISIPILVTLSTPQQDGLNPVESFYCDLYGLSCWLDSDPSSYTLSPQLADDTQHINQILKSQSATMSSSVKNQLEDVLVKMSSHPTKHNPFALLIHYHQDQCYDALNILLRDEKLKKRIHSIDLLRTIQSFDKVEMQTVGGQQVPAPPKKTSLSEYLTEHNLMPIHDLIVEKCYEDSGVFMSSSGYQITANGPEVLLKKRWPFKRNFLLDSDLEVNMHLDLDVLHGNHQRTITTIEQIITPQASAIKAQLSPEKRYFVHTDNANSQLLGKDLTPSDLARYSLYNEKTCICETPLDRQPMGTGMFFRPLNDLPPTDTTTKALFSSPSNTV